MDKPILPPNHNTFNPEAVALNELKGSAGWIILKDFLKSMIAATEVKVDPNQSEYNPTNEYHKVLYREGSKALAEDVIRFVENDDNFAQ